MDRLVEGIRETSKPGFLVGMFLMLGGTVLQNVGLGLMKLALNVNLTLPTNLRKEYWEDVAWWKALFMFLTGAVMDFVALGMLPATVALPLGALGLSVSAWFAHRYLDEKFTRSDHLGTWLISAFLPLRDMLRFAEGIYIHHTVVGSWSAAVVAGKSASVQSAEGLMERVDVTRSSGLYLVIVCAWLFLLLVLSSRMQNVLITAMIPGSVGAFGMVGGKGSSELIQYSISKSNQFTHWFTFVFLSWTVTMLVTQNHFLQTAMRLYEQVIVIPVYYVTVCWFSVLGGIFFFGEWVDTSAMQDFLFCVGVGIVFIGVYLLTRDHHKPHYYQVNPDS